MKFSLTAKDFIGIFCICLCASITANLLWQLDIQNDSLPFPRKDIQ